MILVATNGLKELIYVLCIIARFIVGCLAMITSLICAGLLSIMTGSIKFKKRRKV